MSDRIISWDEYKKLVSSLVFDNKSFYYRGHADENWKLQTSFHRSAAHFNYSIADYLDTIIPEVQYNICAIKDDIINTNDNNEFAAFLALLQHHGFPTPLLDWTFSPYIAAYFAYREINDQYPMSDNVKIYIFDYVEWSKSFEQIYDLRDSKLFVSLLRPFAKFNPRIIPQQGIFTVTNIDDVEDYLIKRSQEVEKTFLYTAKLPVKEKPQIMKDLNLMGINEMTLFPSIDGICRGLKNKFFSVSTIGPSFSERMEQFRKTSSEGETPHKKAARQVKHKKSSS